MAKVNYSSIINWITGKVQGTVFQNSFGGAQIRSKVSPRNPQSNFQQWQRQSFGFTSSTWRALSNIQRNTFIAAAGSPGGGFNLFNQVNSNLRIINVSPLTSFVASPLPPVMQIEVSSYSIGDISIVINSGTTIVPADHTLLIFCTFEQPDSRYYFAPSAYSPITTFAAATDLSSPVNIAAEWTTRFGSMRPGQRLCLYAACINTLSGLRTNSLSTCQNTTDMLPYKIYSANLYISGGGDPTAVEATYNTIPSITWTKTGTSVYEGFLSGAFPVDKTFCTTVNSGSSWIGFYSLYRESDDVIRLFTYNEFGVPTEGIMDNFGIEIKVSY